MISSTLGEFNYPELFVTLHPTDAASRGISDGDAVRVHNELGEVLCRARVSDRVRTGVAAMPKGAWRKSSRNGQTSTALSPAHVNVVAGGACYNDARVGNRALLRARRVILAAMRVLKLTLSIKSPSRAVAAVSQSKTPLYQAVP